MVILITKNGTAYISGYVSESPKYLVVISDYTEVISSFEIGPFSPKDQPILLFSNKTVT